MTKYHVKFNKTVIQKKDFFTWLHSELEANGWEMISSNEAKEGWYYQSKGTSGKNDIIVHIRNTYDNNTHNGAYSFTSTTSRFFEVRAVASYEPSGVDGVDGKSSPGMTSSATVRVNVSANTPVCYPSQKLEICYSINADRVILIITTVKINPSTIFLMFGKPSNKFSKEQRNAGNMVISTHSGNYQAGMSGLVDRSSKLKTDLIVYTSNLPMAMVNDTLWMSEIVIAHENEGIIGTLEGIYAIATDKNMAKEDGLNGDKVIDELGNEFTLYYIAPPYNAGTSSYKPLLTESIIAICTKLAGEE